MAISRIFSTGFEIDEKTISDGNPLFGWEVTSYGAVNGSYMQSTLVRTGTRALYTNNTTAVTINWPTAVTQVQLSMAMARSVSWARQGGEPILFSFGTSSNVLGASLVVNGSGELEARTNDVVRDTYAHSMGTSKWQHIAADIKFHTTTGWFYVWINGVEVLNYTGQTDHLIASTNQLLLNNDLSGFSNYWANGSASYYDDLYVNDSEGEGSEALPTDKRFHYLRANGNGNYTQWTGSDGNSVDNYLHVDDPGYVDTETTRVTDSTATNKDSYTLEDTDLVADVTIDAVIPIVIGRNAGGGDGADGIKLLTRYSSTDSLSATLDLPNGYETIQDRQTTKPGGGAWTAAIVDATEVGVEMQ